MKTSTLLGILVFIAIAIGAVLLAKMKDVKKPSKGAFTKRQIATANEQGMFWRLVESFPHPEFVVLTQVSFGALLNAKGGASRYSFSQKRADFVLLDKTFKVLAVIELDDASHKKREMADAQRDGMLTQAGYNILRYGKTPDKVKVMADVAAFIKQTP